MFPYFQFAFSLLLVGLIIAAPSTVRRIRANESDTRVTLPVIAAVAAAAVATGAVFLGFLFSAQGIKAEEVTKLRAEKVGYSIQSEWMIVQGSSIDKDKSFTDLAMSSEDNFWKDNSTALNNGEKVSFTTKAGKEVTVQLSPSEKGAAYYNAEVTYDGKRVENISRTYKASGIVDSLEDSSWVNDYPTLNLKPVGQKA